MKIKNRIVTYFQTKSPFRITTDILFYLLILSLIVPFSRKYVATGLNKVMIHRPAIIPEVKRDTLASAAYDWIILDMEDQQVPFSQFQGEIVFLSFWATWCPPCRAEMPNIQNLYDEFGSKLNFVLLSQEENDIQREFMDKNDFDLPVYRLVQSPPQILQSSSIPTTFLIDSDGSILVRKTGSAKWDGRFFKEFLAKELNE